MSQTLQICGSGLNRPENENEKTKQRHKADRGRKFLVLGDLVRSSKKVFIEARQ